MLLVLGATASSSLSARTIGARKSDQVSQSNPFLLLRAKIDVLLMIHSHWKRKIKSSLMSYGDS